MQATKTAFALQPVGRELPGGTGQSAAKAESSAQKLEEDDAIGEWRKLAAPDHPVSSRRLGLTLIMFGRKGGLDILLQVGVDSKQTQRQEKLESKIEEKIEEKIEGQITRDEEKFTWRALYGAKPIPASEVAQLKASIGKMNLGWFSNIALEQLYRRAGMVNESRAAHMAAYQSASTMETAADIEGMAFLVGLLMWVAIAIRNVARRLLNTGRAPPESELPAPDTDIQSPIFSYRARTTAFAVYLATFLFIGYPLRKVMPNMHNWSDSAIMRFTSICQIIMYVPVVLIALYTLRRIAAAESPGDPRPRLRETLAALGLRSTRPFADIVVGMKGYILVLPLFLLTHLVSSWVFRGIHTPVNPVQTQALSAFGPWDQLLMLIETAAAAPIVEELMFRGLLFPALKWRWGYVGGVVLTSAVFGLLHPNLPAGFLPLWTLGAAFAVVFQRRQSLLPGIVMHAIHNGFVTIMMFMVFAK
jgi:membrane protease YdiL (CAAX protease family)